MEEERALCGRDAVIYINGHQLLQAQTAELRQKVELHPVRTCFHSEDAAHIPKQYRYVLHLTGIRLKSPFENCNFYDLDYFTVRLCWGDVDLRLEGCCWDDFQAVVRPEQFREHISITALRMIKEVPHEGSGEL